MERRELLVRNVPFGPRVRKHIECRKDQIEKKICPEEGISDIGDRKGRFSGFTGYAREAIKEMKGECGVEKKAEPIGETPSTSPLTPRLRKSLAGKWEKTQNPKMLSYMEETKDKVILEEPSSESSLEEFIWLTDPSSPSGNSPSDINTLNTLNNLDSRTTDQLTIICSLQKEGLKINRIKKHYYPKGKNMTVLLDLDQTLIMTLTKQMMSSFPGIPILFSTYLHIPFVVRPGAINFLPILAQHAEILIYSSGTMEYVRDIVTTVPAFAQNIKYLLTRDDCYQIPGGYLKSIKVINRNIQNVIALDDSPWVYWEDLDNVIPLQPFTLDHYQNDIELETALEFILSILQIPDVRKPIRNKFKLKALAHTFYKKYFLGDSHITIDK